MSTPPPEDHTLDIGGLRIIPGDRLGPYVYKHLVGRGGMANVILATNPDGQPVALKVLKAHRMATGLTRFKREFRALARLRHPNVIRVEAYGDIHGHPYIAMEYVEGTDLHNTIHSFRGWKPAERWRRCEEILVDLCRALAYIHRRGLIHRDLKPSNVLIDVEGRCKLTDFGIVKDLDPQNDTQVSTTLVGTWAYASPEQMQGQGVDHRSDLYSLGVMLFAMLTGRRPFVAKDLNGYLTLHRTQNAPRAREIDPGVPLHLDEICERLLRKSPRERFRSAQEILYRLEQEDAIPDVDVSGGWTPALVGRRHEEEQLRERVATLTSRRGGVVWVEGGEGSGKSRMLDVAEAHAMLIGLAVVRARVEERESALAPMLRMGRSVHKEIPAGAAATELSAAVEAFGAEGEGAPGNARERLTDAIGDALAQLVEDGPLAILIDDIHRARVPTLDALAALMRRFDGAPLLFVGSLSPDRLTPRTEALCSGAFLTETPLHIALPPLPVEAIVDLAAGLLGAGRPADALAERLHRETQGNPLFVTLFLQHLMGQGILVRVPADTPSGRPARDRPAWRIALDVDEIAAGHLEIPPGIRQIIRARLSPLTTAQRQLCEALAVYGPPMELDVLLEVLNLDEDTAAVQIDVLDDAGILTVNQHGDNVSVDFTHSKFADITYRELALDARASLHRRIAETLTHQPQNVAAAEVVGEHYRRAGEAGKAWQYLIAAAAGMRDRSLYNEARELSERAEALEEAARVEVDEATLNAGRQKQMQVDADIAIAAGDWAGARDCAEQAVALGPESGDDPATLRARLTLTRVLRAAGALDAAEAEAEEALLSARVLRDPELLAEALRVHGGVAWARGRIDDAEVSFQDGLTIATTPATAAVRGHLLLAVSAVQIARGSLPGAGNTLDTAAELLAGLHLKPFEGVALALRAEVRLAEGRMGDALADASRGLVLAIETRHPYAEALARGALGAVAHGVGRTADALSELESAVRLARSLRLPSDVAAPAARLARVRLERHEISAAMDLLEVASASLAQGDPDAISPLLHALRARILASSSDARRAAPLVAGAGLSIANLPPIRAAEVGLELGRAALLLGTRMEASRLATEAAVTARSRGAWLLRLGALQLLARAHPDPDDRRTAAASHAALLQDLSQEVPERWRAAFVAHWAV